LLEHTSRSKGYSAAFLAVFAVTFSLASFDWLMSIEPEFYSTIYALYCFSGLILSGVAAITVCVILLRRRGWLAEAGPHHLHSLGKLVLGYSTFWAYIWLCQYILIYYANLPEETIYYIRRTATRGWTALFLLNLFLNWVIPFVLLLSRNAKRNATVLLSACVIVLAGHWLDLYLMVVPAFGGAQVFGWVDTALLAGFTALFALIFLNSLAKAPLLPERDPYLDESLSTPPAELPENELAWSRQSKRALALSTAAFGMTFAVWGLIGALAPRFREMYQLSSLQTALLIAIPVILGAVGRLPMGILADRFGGRRVFGLLLIFCLIPALGVSFTHSYGGLLAWAFFIGLAGTSFSVGVAFISKWFANDQQGTALGMFGMGNIGQSVAMFGAPALVLLTEDWRVPFWVFGTTTGLFGLVFLWLARNAPVTSQAKPLGEYFGVLKREPLAWVLALFYFLTFGGFVALSIYLPTLLKDLFGLRPTDAGFRVAGFVVVATIMRPVGGWLADRYGGARILSVVFVSLAALALGLTSLNMVVFTAGALGTAGLLGLGNGAVFKLVPQFFPRSTGTVTGLVGAAGGLGGFFPPLVLGVVKASTGSFMMGFVLLSGFALLCLLVNYWVFERRNEEAPDWVEV
jgi:NNP family nitrate/nitrite transporter-like MFS transporter